MDEASISSITNPLATSEQLRASASFLDGIPDALEQSLRYQGSRLTQSAGILLDLSQDIVAQAIVIFLRFFTGAEGGSFRMHGVKDMSAAALFLTAKISATPQSMRAVLNVYAFLTSDASPLVTPGVKRGAEIPDPTSYTISEGEYQAQRQRLMLNEALILRHIGYSIKVVLPHALALTYVQTLASAASKLTQASKQRLAARTVALLNSALFSPQLLYLTHQPHALAVAAVYLAARETGCRIGGGEWWLTWDVSREELGFLVLALCSTEAWLSEQSQPAAWTVVQVEDVLKRSTISN